MHSANNTTGADRRSVIAKQPKAGLPATGHQNSPNHRFTPGDLAHSNILLYPQMSALESDRQPAYNRPAQAGQPPPPICNLTKSR